jgi:hypothetical protein
MSPSSVWLLAALVIRQAVPESLGRQLQEQPSEEQQPPVQEQPAQQQPAQEQTEQTERKASWQDLLAGLQASLEERERAVKEREDALLRQNAAETSEAESLKEGKRNVEKWAEENNHEKTMTIKEREGHIEALEKKVDELHLRIADLDNQVDSLRGQVSEKDQRLAELKAMYADPSLQHFLESKAKKVYRGGSLEGAANQTYKYIVPSLEAGRLRGSELLNSTLSAFAGAGTVEDWMPAESGALVYGMVSVPLLCSVWCLTRVVLRLRPCLLFCHFYLAMTCVCASIMAVWVGADPMLAFAAHDPSAFVFSQLWFGLLLCIYGLVLLGSLCCARRDDNVKEKFARSLQLGLFAPVFLSYFGLVWSPAMGDSSPILGSSVSTLFSGSGDSASFLPYIIGAGVFFAMLRMEQKLWSENSTDKDISISLALEKDGQFKSVSDKVHELAQLIGSTNEKEK